MVLQPENVTTASSAVGRNKWFFMWSPYVAKTIGFYGLFLCAGCDCLPVQCPLLSALWQNLLSLSPTGRQHALVLQAILHSCSLQPPSPERRDRAYPVPLAFLPMQTH